MAPHGAATTAITYCKLGANIAAKKGICNVLIRLGKFSGIGFINRHGGNESI